MNEPYAKLEAMFAELNQAVADIERNSDRANKLLAMAITVIVVVAAAMFVAH